MRCRFNGRIWVSTEVEQAETAATATAAPVMPRAGLERRLRAMLADWKGLLLGELPQARDVLRTLLVGPLRFTPVVDERRRGYRFEGAVALDRLVAGVVDLPTGVVSPICASWNQWRAWLRGVDGLRRAA